ncbi:DUF58 domain-containing protein [Amnibacterium sp.]|uniref:DUF58 domain-containing protein n=1 Tax=Amnibacterium sp. TaxID=1872496 RepID=UPI002617DF74|nr:DUF58 domain-containing protein [Amnibacterium sp.]
MRLTRRGWGLAITAFLGVVAAYVAGWPALLAVALFLGGLVGAGALAVALVPTRATAERRLAPDVTEPGRAVTVRLTIAGHASAGAEWRDDTNRRLEVIGSASGRLPRLGGGTTAVEVEYEVVARRRGRIPVGPLLVERTDPLGVATAKRRSGEPAQLTVLPVVHEVLPPVAATRVDLDPDAAAVFGMAGEQRDIIAREYRAGDPMRSVDWRSTAHRGELMVRAEAAAAAVSTALAFDAREAVWPDERTFEWGVEAAASLVAAVGRRGSAVRFATDGSTPVRADADRTLISLATISRTEDGPDPADLVRRLRGQDVQVLHLITGVGALRDLGRLPPLGQGTVGLVSLIGAPLEPVPAARGWRIQVIDPTRPVEEAWARG